MVTSTAHPAVTPPTTDPRPSPAATPAQSRLTAALFIAGPAIYLLAEFISAAAWTNPPYSYTADFISDLGVHGPSTLFGQYMYSPLAWVMNTGFFLFGLVILAGTASLRGALRGRRLGLLIPAAMLAAGGILLAIFHGSGEALTDGTGQFHSLGAFAGFIGGNVLVIVLGVMRQRLGLTPTVARTLVIAGVIGVISMVGYLAAIFSSGDTTIGLIGLVERGAVEPFLIGLICMGVSMWHGWGARVASSAEHPSRR